MIWTTIRLCPPLLFLLLYSAKMRDIVQDRPAKQWFYPLSSISLILLHFQMSRIVSLSLPNSPLRTLSSHLRP